MQFDKAAVVLSICLIGHKEGDPIARNNRKNTEQRHFMAPFRGVVFSARNR